MKLFLDALAYIVLFATLLLITGIFTVFAMFAPEFFLVVGTVILIAGGVSAISWATDRLF